MKTLYDNYPILNNCKQSIEKALSILIKCYENQNKLLVCGNGGSASDCDHIVGELMKSFTLERKIDKDLYDKISVFNQDLANNLQQALPCINLSSHTSLLTAYANDNNFDYVFAQQVLGYAKKDDVVLGLTTSGNSKDVVNAMLVAKQLGLKTIGLTGNKKCKLDDICDVVIKVDKEKTSEIQELHLPIYHYLCQSLENYFFT